MATDNKRGIILTVGGSPYPILNSLSEKPYSHVLFIVSVGERGSKKQVDDIIIPALLGITYPEDFKCEVCGNRSTNIQQVSEGEVGTYHSDHYIRLNELGEEWYEFLPLSNHQDIATCYQQMRAGIDKWTRARGLATDDVFVDFTGGTKVMSSAIVLAAIERFSKFAYVGGQTRDRRGLGIVTTGDETILEYQNPWTTYAVRELERAQWLLDTCHAEPAARILSEAAQKCDLALKSRLLAYADIAQFLGRTDRFDFREHSSGRREKFSDALKKLDEAFDTLQVSERDPGLYDELTSLRDHLNAVSAQVKDDGTTPARETLLELLANAERRARQARFDDAVGRLYRITELYGQQLAKQAFGFELGVGNVNDFPIRSKPVIRDDYNPDRNGKIEFGVRNLYRILQESEDSRLRDKAGIADALKTYLDRRNSSLLAHGNRPVSERDFQSFWKNVLPTLGVDDADIPRWPKFELSLE